MRKEAGLTELDRACLRGRWWYVLPDWPPKDFDYTAALAEAGAGGAAVGGLCRCAIC